MNYLRFLAALFILSVCFSCKTKEVLKPNSPPNPFTVTATLADNGKDILLKWTKSKDLDGDAVTYAVVYKDTLVKNLSDTTYIIKDIPYGTDVKGSVVAKDLKEGLTVAPFSIQTGTLFVKISDINFEKALIKLKIDDVQDGQVLRSAVESVLELNISSTVVGEDKIVKLDGIEAFINLKSLDCSYQSITSLDMSKNVNLTYLYCTANKLNSLNISKNIRLTYLYCVANKLNSLDISKNIVIKDIRCGLNKLTSIDVKANPKLATLYCDYNELTTLDISKNNDLEYLDCRANWINNLDISKNLLLTYLNCSDNFLRNLNVSKNTNIRLLQCNNNLLSSLNTINNSNVQLLKCEYNELKDLDISKNIILEQLSCQNNNIQTICVNNLNQVKSDWEKDAPTTYKVCN